MPFTILRGDISRVQADALVNAANSSLTPGGGMCGTLFSAAGFAAMDRACRAIGHCPVGQVVYTPGFALPARYVIHAVGPVWQGGGRGEDRLLRMCYDNALALAKKLRCRSVALPLISTGHFGFPPREAMRIARDAIRDFLQGSDMQVILVVFDRTSFLLGEELYGRVRAYIDDHYDVPPRRLWEDASFRRLQEREQEAMDFSRVPTAFAAPMAAPARETLPDRLRHLDEPFSRTLLRLIDEKGMTDVEVYKRANMDRKLFSKLRKPTYTPGKATVLSLAIALRLNLEETRALLEKAGFALSHSSQSDVIVEYFIGEGIYDIFTINQALFEFDQKPLGA